MYKDAWPFPRLRLSLVLGIGLLALAICLFPFWGAISLAAIFAFGLRKPLDRFRHRFRLGNRFVGAIAIMLLLLAILIPLALVGLRLYQIAAGQKEKGIRGAFSQSTIHQASTAYQKLESKVAQHAANWRIYQDTADARQALRHALGSLGQSAFTTISGAVLNIPELVVTTLVFTLFLYLFLSRGRRIGQALSSLDILSEADVSRLANVLQAACYNTIVTNVVVGAIQASIVTVGARIFGFSESVLIFTVVFFLSFIPFIGASPVAFALAIVAFLTGNSGQGIGMTVVGVIAGTIDNVIRPYLISDGESEVHPIVSFAVILGAIAVLGLKGLFLGPVILTATFGLLLRKGKEAPAEAAERKAS